MTGSQTWPWSSGSGGAILRQVSGSSTTQIVDLALRVPEPGAVILASLVLVAFTLIGRRRA